MKFLSPSSGFSCMWFVVFLLSSFFVSGLFRASVTQGHNLGIFWCLQYQAQRGDCVFMKFHGKHNKDHMNKLPQKSSNLQIRWFQFFPSLFEDERNWYLNHAADELDDGLPHFADVQDGFARYTRGTSCNRYNSIKTCPKGCQATLRNQILCLECMHGPAVKGIRWRPQWFWTHIYENLLLHFPASKNVSERNREMSTDSPLEFSDLSSQKIHREVRLFHRSQALLTYLAMKKKARKTSTWEPNNFWPWKPLGKWEKLEKILFEKNLLWGCKACSLMLIGFGILFDLHGWPTVVGGFAIAFQMFSSFLYMFGVYMNMSEHAKGEVRFCWTPYEKTRRPKYTLRAFSLAKSYQRNLRTYHNL